MSLDIKNLSYAEQDVGQHIKSTKKRFIWEFQLDGSPHKVELYDSRISGKKKLVKDGQVFKEVEGDVAFSKSFEIGKYSCTIIQHGEKYELRVNNQSFAHLMDLEKNRLYFSPGNNPTSNTYTAKAENNTNKIGFGMGQLNNQTNPKPNGLFNFSIKATSGTAPKRFSEMPSHDFSLSNKFTNNVREEREQQTRDHRSASLLDFTNGGEVNVPSNQNKINSINLLDTIDFSTTVNSTNFKQNNEKDFTNNVFDLTSGSNKNESNGFSNLGSPNSNFANISSSSNFSTGNVNSPGSQFYQPNQFNQVNNNMGQFNPMYQMQSPMNQYSPMNGMNQNMNSAYSGQPQFSPETNSNGMNLSSYGNGNNLNYQGSVNFHPSKKDPLEDLFG